MTEHVLVAANQVTADLLNSDGTHNVYLTTDPAVNALTLTLRNGLSDAVVFPPGTPVAYEDLPKGQSAIYIFLNGLIDNTDIANIVLAAAGWTAGTFTDSNSLQYLVIAPSSQVTMQPGGTLAFSLTNVLVPGSPRSGTADIDLAGATGVTPLQSDVPLFVNIANPPQPDKKKLDVDIGFAAPAAVYTGQPQSLTLHLVNKGQTPLVPGGTNSWGGLTPTFQLTLVYGTGAGALTTVEKAAQIATDISNEYGNVWQPPQRHVQGKSPYWTMQPDPNGGGTVLGTGENATIEFAVTGIETTLPAGLDSAITVAYVSWYDVPGYDDGSTGVIITKKAGPRVVTFSAMPPSVPVGQQAVQSILTWDTAHATGVRFDAPQINPAQTFWTSGSGPIDGGISIPKNTTLTVIAYKDISSDHPVVRGERPRLGDAVITDSKSIYITSPSRTDVTAGIGNLGDVVVPAGGTSAFLFQMNIGGSWSAMLTQAAVLDLTTQKITSTVDLKALIPSQGGGTLIDAAVPSPDGSTIHVLASSGEGASNLTPQFYILPMNVASASYGKPVSLGQLVPSGQVLSPTLLATPDGSTLYLSAGDFKLGPSHVYALDAATYATKGSWTWQTEKPQQLIGPAVPVACDTSGGKLLMAGWAGQAVIDVTAGFTMTGVLNLGQQLSMLVGAPVVSSDVTRGYLYGFTGSGKPFYGHLVAIDIDLATGALSVAKDISFGEVPVLVGPAALSSDGRALAVLTAADIVTVFDTTSFAAVPYYCGVSGNFTPLLIVQGTQPSTIYATGGNGYANGVMSIVTLA